MVNITLPQNAQKIDKNTMEVRSKKMFTKSEMQKINNNQNKNFYKIDDLSLAFWDVLNSQLDNRTLEQIKAESLEMFKLTPQLQVIDANIKKINNKRFFVMRYCNGDVCYTKFITERKNHNTLNGSMEYKVTDRNKADSTLNEILSTISFK